MLHVETGSDAEAADRRQLGVTVDVIIATATGSLEPR
jgi:hypothetical protein